MALEICRVCGTTTGDLKNILSGGNDELVEQMRLCANIQIDIYDNLPKFVCKQCEDGLAFSYRLRKRGEETEKKLREDFLLTSIEPFTLGNESFVQTQNDCMMVEFCDDEIWEKDEKDVYCEEDVLIDRASDSNEELSQDLHEDPDNENDNWASLENEFYTENAYIENTVEIIENTVIEPIEEVSIELIEANEEFTVEQNETIETEMDSKHLRNISKNSYTNQNLNTKKNLISGKSNSRSHPCALCSKTFTKSTNLASHMNIHFKEKQYSCEICGKKMRYQNNLRVHMQTIHKNLSTDNLKLIVDKSNSSFPNVFPENCKKITKIFWHGKCRIFKCTLCDKLSHMKSSHINHCKIHLNEKPFKCEVCNKSFRQMYTLKEHKIIHSGLRPFKCSMCSKSFLQKSALAKHTFWHTGIKPFECSICGTSFRNRDVLKSHEQIHIGKMAYSCDICSQKFCYKRQLSAHNKMCHFSKTQNLVLQHSEVYFCEYKKCNKKYTKRLSLLVHMRQHMNPSPVNNTLECGDCRRKFTKPIYLWKHQKIFRGNCVSRCKLKMISHKNMARSSENKCFVCSLCGKKFAYYILLAKHRRYQHYISQYKCNKCQMNFFHLYSLQLHMRKHPVALIEIIPAYEYYETNITVEKQEEQTESFLCPYCNKRISNEELLENHLFFYHDVDVISISRKS